MCSLVSLMIISLCCFSSLTKFIAPPIFGKAISFYLTTNGGTIHLLVSKSKLTFSFSFAIWLSVSIMAQMPFKKSRSFSCSLITTSKSSLSSFSFL